MLTLANGTVVRVRPVPALARHPGQPAYIVGWRRPSMPAMAYWPARTHGEALAAVLELAPEVPTCPCALAKRSPRAPRPS